MRKLTISLMALVALMFLPFSAFAQTPGFEPSSETITGLMTLPEERIESFTFEKFQEGYTWELDNTGHLYKNWDADWLANNAETSLLPKNNMMVFYEGDLEPETGTFRDHTNVLNEDGSYTMSTHMPYLENEQGDFVPYQLTEDNNTVLVEVDGGKFSFDKNAGAVTVSDSDGVVISSDSYIVRQAQLNTNDWNELTVNNESVVTTVEESDEKVIVTFTRENFEGVFKIEYKISSGTLKTTAYFTNNSFDDSKFAFTETIQLPTSIITLNAMEDIDLSNYVGMTVPREILEENEDLILQIKDLYYNTGIGFEKLWSVSILDSNTVALDYANIGEVSTPIGATVELDPSMSFVNGNELSPGVNSTYSQNCSSGSSSWVYYPRNYNAGPGYNGCRAPIVEFDISSIPDSATITSVDMSYEIDWVNGVADNVDWNTIELNTWSSTEQAWYDAINHNGVGQSYVTNDGGAFNGVGSLTVTNLGTLGNTNLQNQLTSANSINGVADWFAVAFPFSSITQTVLRDVGYTNVGMSVTYNLPPSIPPNLSATINYPNVDLSWTGSDSGAGYVVSSIAKNNYGSGIALPATWSLWQGGATPTTPTMGVPGVIGGAFDFNGSTDMVGANFVTGYPNSGVQPTQGSISIWVKPEASGSSVGNPFGGTGFQSYWITNTPMWPTYPSNSFNMGSLYSNANAFTMNAWNHIVVTIDSTTSNNITTVYVNGSPLQMYTYPSGTGGGSASNQNSKTVGNLLANTILGGQYNSSPQFKYPFDGKIDEFSSWDKVLSQSEVTTLYNSGNGNTPDSINSNNNLITYFPLDDTSSPLPNKAVTSDPVTVTYSVKRDGLQIATTTSTTYSDSPPMGSLYDYNIAGTTSSGSSDDSNTASANLSGPNSPTGVTATMNGNNVDLAWTVPSIPNGSIVGYKVESSTDGTTWSTVVADTGNSSTTYTDTNPTMGSFNYYKVSGINAYGVGSDSVVITDIISGDRFNLFDGSYGVTGSACSTPASTWSKSVNQGTGYIVLPSTTTTNNNCYLTANSFDISSIPDTATVTSTKMTFDITGSSAATTNCDVIGIDTDASDSSSDIYNDITSGGSTLLSNNAVCASGVSNGNTIDLGTNGITEITSDLTGGETYFSIGFEPTNMVRGSSNIEQQFKNHVMEIVYQVTPPGVLAGTLPAAPTNLAATTADPIVLTWTASPDPDAASPVLHYSIERSTDGTNWTTLSANVGNVVTYTDNTTTAGTIYHYQVSAVTNAGTGPASTPTSASAGTVSTPPQTLAVTQTTVGQLDLSWAAPADDGSTGGITGYKVYRDGAVIATLGNVLIYNDATIAAGTQYTYTVTALNAAGESTVSNGIVTTSWAVPDAPTGATASGGIPIVINWNTPNSDSPITDYKVYRDGSLVATVTAPTLTYSDSNVTPNTTYSYTISAVSAVGEGAQSSSTSGQSGVPPAQITTFTATPVDSSRIKLDWAAPNDNGYTITSYKIYKGGNLIGTTAGLTYTDTGLQNNTTYSYTVTAVNVGGEGTQSAAQTATTATPLSPPTNAYTEEHVTSVTVTWDKVIGAVSYTVERDGVILGTTADFWYVDSTAAASTSYVYKVYANSSAVNGLNGTTSSVTTASATSHQYITVTPTAPNANAYPIDMYELHRNGAMVGYLEPNNLVYEDHDVSIGTTYTYQVRAHNLLGWSQLSPVGSVTTWNVPDVITTLSGNIGSPIVLNWSAPNSDKPITLYTVYRDGSLLATTTNITYSDASVAAGTTYVYTVTATSIIGEGVQSSGLSLQAGTVPTVPQNAAVTVQSGNNILFSWTAPSSNGGVPITGYNPQVSTDGGTTWTDLLATPTTALSFTHTGLVTGQNYSYQVAAINSVGNSPYTAVLSAIAGDVPAQVTGLSTTAVSDTEIDLTWNIPANNAYPVSSYNILRSTDGTTWTTLTSTTNSYSDTGLTADTNYAYKVSAVNTLGTGIESSTVQQRTFGLPDPVTTITLSPQSTTQINLSWTQPNLNGFSLVGYTVQQSTDSGATWTTLSTQTSTTYSATALTQNTVYDYRINTENTFGSIDGTSNAATTYPIATNLISGVTQSDTEIQVTWNAIAGNGAVQYSLERSVDSGVTWTPATIYITSTTFTDTGLTPLSGYNYRVTSVNSAGLSSTSISSNTVTTFGPPEAPTNLALTALLNAEIKLDWSAPTVTNGGPITGYNIERSTNGSTWSVVINNISGLTYTDTGLTTSQVYYYKVSAVNAYGISVFSSSANVMASDVPSQVTGLTATTLPNYEIQLDWTAPNANGYPISGYTIERSTDAGSTWNILVANTQNTNITYTDINLTVSQTYHYRISAVNQVGTGLASADANAQAGDVPDATVLTATPTTAGQIDLSWTVPNDNGFTITKYLVERSTDGITYAQIASIVPSTGVTTYSDTGIVGTLYYYKVTTENAVGFSADSNVESLNAGDIPGITTNLAGTTQSDTQINLTWSAAAPNGYPITGYKIEQSVDNLNWTPIVPDTQTAQTSHTVSGLTEKTDYYYRVSGINTIGSGPVSSTVLLHTFGPPDAITVISGTTTSTSATLTWTAPYDHGSAITGYKVEVQDFVTGNWLNLSTVSTTTYTQINMIPNTQYEYRVTAINPYGTSYSPNTVLTTLSVASGTPTVTVISGTELRVDWAAATGTGVTYNIYTSPDDITYTAGPVGHPTAYYNHQGLPNGQTVYYKITVVNTSGESAPSPSAVGTTYTTADAPTNIQVTHSTPLSATITWTAPANDGGDPNNLSYTLQRSNDNANWASITPTTGLTATDTPLTPGTQYYWRVNSVNTVGIGGTSGTVSYLAPDVPTAPGSLTAALTGANNNAAVLNWVAPSSTFGYPVIGYHIEVNENSGTWETLVQDTGNSGLVYTNTGLSAGSSYVYRVSAITAVGEGVPSNTATVNPILVSLSITGTSTGGNSVSVSPTITTSGASSAIIVQQALYRDNVRVDLVSLNIPLTSGASLPSMIDYPTQTSSYVMTIVLDTGYVIQSQTNPPLSLTPSSPFTGDISFSEDRTEYDVDVDCTAAGGQWDINKPVASAGTPQADTAFKCSKSYTESVLEFTVQPVGAEVIISYQPQNINEPAIVKAFTATSSQISETTELDRETDYYGSIIVNPTFEYTKNADQTITVICDPNDIMCQPGDQVPKGVPSEKTFKSFKAPSSVAQLGIEPMGNLFGVNMVFIFVIAIAGIFTGRSAPMGVVFIVITLGIMAYLGYLDFGSDAMNTATWALLIVSAILGIFLGKRWS